MPAGEEEEEEEEEGRLQLGLERLNKGKEEEEEEEEEGLARRLPRCRLRACTRTSTHLRRSRRHVCNSSIGTITMIY